MSVHDPDPLATEFPEFYDSGENLVVGDWADEELAPEPAE